MKKIVSIALLGLSFNTFAQKIDASKVPAVVKSSFEKEFPKAGELKWEKEKGNYEANFKKVNTKMAALFDAKGGLLETETAIKISELPKEALAYINKNYKDQVKEAALINKPGGIVNYEAEIKGMDLIFDGNGKFIKTAKD